MKALLIVLSLVSVPAFADVGFNFNFGPRGPGFGFGWRPGHPGWGGHRPVECMAQNGRGMTFLGYGRWVQEAQNNAMYSCYRQSRNCVIRYCR